MTDFGVKGFQALCGRNQTDIGQSGTRVVTVGWGTGTLAIFVAVVKVRVARGTVTFKVAVMITAITITTVAVNTVAVAGTGTFITTGRGAVGAVAIGMVMGVGAEVIGVLGVANVVGHEWSPVVAVWGGAFGLLARVEVGGAVTVTMFWGIDLHFFSFCFVVERLFVGGDGVKQAGWGRCEWLRRVGTGNGGRAVSTFVVGFGAGNVCGWNAFAGEAPAGGPLPDAWVVHRTERRHGLPSGIEIESLKINIQILVFLTEIHAKIIGAFSHGSIQM